MRAIVQPGAVRPLGWISFTLGSDVSAAEVDLVRSPLAVVTLYTSPICPPCRVLKGRLERAGVDFDVVDLAADENRELVASFKARGLVQTPIVIADDIEFAGFNPHEIQKVIERFGRQAE